MKNSITKLVFPAFLAIGLAVIVQSCLKTEDLFKDIPIYIDTDLLNNSLSVNIINANDNSTAKPKSITVELTGKDKDKLYSLLGQKEIPVADHVLKIGIKKSQLPTCENGAIQFTAVVKADGFMECIKNFTIAPNETVNTFVGMIEERNPPTGVSIQKFQTGNVSDGMRQSSTFETSLAGKRENAALTFEKGTKFFDSAGGQYLAGLDVKLAHFDNRTDESLAYFPGGLTAPAKDQFGNSMGNVQFIPFSFGKIEVTYKKTPVNRWDIPAKFRVKLNTDFLNPNTGEFIQVGDNIDFWTFSKADMTWTKAYTTTIENYGGNLMAAVDLTTPIDYWAVGFAATADHNVLLRFTSRVTDLDPEVYYYVKVIQFNTIDDPYRQVLFEGYRKLVNFEEIQLLNVTDSGYGCVEVWNSKFECNGGNLLEKQFFYWEPHVNRHNCYDREFSLVYIDLGSSINANNRFPITVDIFGVCANGDTVLRGVPSLDLMYSLANCEDHSQFELLGRLRSGIGNTGALEPGKYYNFFFEQGEVSKCLLNFRIPTRDTVVRIASPVYNYYEDVYVEVDEVNRRIDFKWHNALVPEKACEEYRQYY